MKQEPLLRIEVESRTTPGKVYVVTQKRDQTWACGCPGFLFKYRALGEDCKHIEACKQDIEMERISARRQKITGIREVRIIESEVKTSPKVAGGVMLRKLLID